MTIRVSSGNNSAWMVNGSAKAGHSANQAVIDSLVQNDHRMQMNQNVAYVLAMVMVLLCQVQAALPRLRLRPYLIS